MLFYFAFPRLFLATVAGLKCPSNIMPGPSPCSHQEFDRQCSEYIKALMSLNCPGTDPDGFGPMPKACSDKVMLGLVNCPFVAQLTRANRLASLNTQTQFIIGLILILTTSGSVVVYRMVAHEGLAPGRQISWRLIAFGIASLSASFALVCVCFPANLGLGCLFACLSLTLAAGAWSLRREMQALVEPPQQWPGVLPLQDSLTVVREFDRDCAMANESYNFTLQVMDVFVIHNQDLEERYLRVQQEFATTHANIQQLYHGSSAAAVKQIVSDGFQLPAGKGGYMGRAIYFADTPLKAWHFSRSGYILVCNVALGIAKELRGPNQKLSLDDLRDPFTTSMKYDSVVALPKADGGRLTSKEYGIYREAQAVPVFLLRVREAPKTNLLQMEVPDSLTVDTEDSDEDIENGHLVGDDELEQAQAESAEGVDAGSAARRQQRRSHHQRRRERNWRSRQIPTPDPFL